MRFFPSRSQLAMRMASQAVANPLVAPSAAVKCPPGYYFDISTGKCEALPPCEAYYMKKGATYKEALEACAACTKKFMDLGYSYEDARHACNASPEGPKTPSPVPVPKTPAPKTPSPFPPKHVPPGQAAPGTFAAPSVPSLSEAQKVDTEESIHLASAIKKTYPRISVHPTVPASSDGGICVLVEDGSEGKKASGGTGWLVCCLETVGEHDMIVCYAAKIKSPEDAEEDEEAPSHYAVLGGKIYGVSRGRKLAENPQQNPFYWAGYPYAGYPVYPYYSFAYPYYAWGGYPYYYPWYGYGYPWWGVWYGGGFRRHGGRPMRGGIGGGGMGGGGFSPMGGGGGFSPMGAGGGGGGIGKNPYMPWNMNQQGYPTA